MDDLLTRYNKLLRQNEVLHKENEVLKSLLKIHGIEYETRMKEDMNKPIYSLVSVPTITLSIDERIRLFQSLFKGREDVFARRWFSKTTGKSGYQPVCINEWKQGLCDKKKYRCAICPNRNFAPLTTQDMYRHLEGKDEYCCDVVGLYAIMQDNNCAFLCADFDDKNCKYGYKEDVLAFVGVCREWLIPYAIERSRSGNGAHVWIFFEAPLPASKARRLGNAILTEAMTRNGQMSFNSYDRFFPNQDYLPEGGLATSLHSHYKVRHAGNRTVCLLIMISLYIRINGHFYIILRRYKNLLSTNYYACIIKKNLESCLCRAKASHGLRLCRKILRKKTSMLRLR